MSAPSTDEINANAAGLLVVARELERRIGPEVACEALMAATVTIALNNGPPGLVGGWLRAWADRVEHEAPQAGTA